MMAGSESDVEHWTDSLARSPLFAELESDDGGCSMQKNVTLMCEIRGDLFVWSEARKALLTTNLKRLMAHPEEQLFQILMCTSAPETELCELLPDPAGAHVALVCRQSLGALRLHRHRGEHGEFGGGRKSVNCKVISVAKVLFTVYRHSLTLTQAQWHPTQPGALCLLTSDSTLHVYSLASPSDPLLSLPLTEAPNIGYTLKDSIVQFTPSPLPASTSSPSTSPSTSPPLLFLLRPNGDISTVSLSAGSAHSPPLAMHPEAEDNYEDGEACSLLLLPTTPLTVVLGNSCGTIYHCILLPGEEGGEEWVGVASDMLYAVECVRLQFTQQLQEGPIRLLPDPVNPHGYFAVHVEGVHRVALPWLASVEAFSGGNLGVLQLEPATETVLLLSNKPDVTSLVGVVIVTEALLGSALLTLSSDGGCCALALNERLAPPPLPRTEGGGASPLRQAHHDDAFVEMIRDILRSGQVPGASPVLRGLSGPSQDSQQRDCFDLLRRSVSRLRRCYLRPQQQAKEELARKIGLLRQQTEQQPSELTYLQDEREEVERRAEEIAGQLAAVRSKHQQLIKRVERLMCRLDSHSPVLSIEEVKMGQELEGLDRKLTLMEGGVKEAQGKLTLGLGWSQSAKVRGQLSHQQCSIILVALTEGGDQIKTVKDYILSLMANLPPH